MVKNGGTEYLKGSAYQSRILLPENKRMTPQRSLREQYQTWRRQVTVEKRKLAEEVETALKKELAPEEAQRVFLFGSCVWGIPHWRSDVDLAIDDENFDDERTWRLWNKVFAIAERFFGEEKVDVCFLSELPDRLKDRIRREGRRISDV